MSNAIKMNWPHDEWEKRATPLRSCPLVWATTCLLVAAAIAGSELKKQTLWRQNTSTVALTEEQQGLADALIYTIPAPQWLPVTRSWNREEINILKEFGKDGYYVFCDEDKTITYWKVQSWVSTESGTFTLIW